MYCPGEPGTPWPPKHPDTYSVRGPGVLDFLQPHHFKTYCKRSRKLVAQRVILQQRVSLLLEAINSLCQMSQFLYEWHCQVHLQWCTGNLLKRLKVQVCHCPYHVVNNHDDKSGPQNPDKRSLYRLANCNKISAPLHRFYFTWHHHQWY